MFPALIHLMIELVRRVLSALLDLVPHFVRVVLQFAPRLLGSTLGLAPYLASVPPRLLLILPRAARHPKNQKKCKDQRFPTHNVRPDFVS